MGRKKLDSGVAGDHLMGASHEQFDDGTNSVRNRPGDEWWPSGAFKSYDNRGREGFLSVVLSTVFVRFYHE